MDKVMAVGAQMGLLSPDDALFLDFDGTLARLQDDPDTVFLEDGLAEVLLALSEQLGGALAILSGRGLSDLCRRVPDALWRFGNHGLFSAEPGDAGPTTPPPTPVELLAGLKDAILPFDQVRIEPKGPVIAIHYRAAPGAGEALGAILKDVMSKTEDYKLQHGKFVYELKPAGANKGICIAKAMQMAPFEGRRPVMIGDDTTDEDAFETALEQGGLAIKVGEGETRAPYRLEGVDAVHSLLKHGL